MLRSEGSSRRLALGLAAWFLLFVLLLPATHTCRPFEALAGGASPAPPGLAPGDGDQARDARSHDCLACRLSTEAQYLAATVVVPAPPASVAAQTVHVAPPVLVFGAPCPLPRGPGRGRPVRRRPREAARRDEA